MQRQQQHVIGRAQPQERRPQRRPALQIEPPRDLVPTRAAGSPPRPGEPDRSSTRRSNGDGGWTAWRGSPSTVSNVVRSTSCRRTISVSAARSASASSGPSSRNAIGMLYDTLPGSSCSMNHRRCCENDNGRRRAGGAGAGGGGTARAASIAAGEAGERRRFEQRRERQLDAERTRARAP